MSIELLRKIVEAHPDLPDGAFAYDGGLRKVGTDGIPAPRKGRMICSVVLAACDELSLEVIAADKGVVIVPPYKSTAKEIRFGAWNNMQQQPTPEKAESCEYCIPIGYLRHLVKLAKLAGKK